MTPEERSAKWSTTALANVKAQFERTGRYFSVSACRIGGYITIHNRFHQDQTYENCPVCNGTLEQIRSEN
jgi:hypothetical protein